MVGVVAFFLLFPQLKPDWIQIHVGQGQWGGGRRFPTRHTSWTRATTPVRTTSAATKAEAAWDRGVWHMEREEWDECIKEFTEVIRLEPKNGDAYFLRGIVKHYQQEFDAAIADYDAAIKLDPKDTDALLNRGKARFDLEQDSQALTDVEAALHITPNNAEALCLRGKIREVANQYREALPDYQKAAKLEPDNPAALNYLAWLLATAADDSVRDGKKATELALRAVELENAKEWDTIDTLAAAFAESGRFAEAIKSQNEALRLAPTEEHEDLKSRLELYQSNKPYRQDQKSP